MGGVTSSTVDYLLVDPAQKNDGYVVRTRIGENIPDTGTRIYFLASKH